MAKKKKDENLTLKQRVLKETREWIVALAAALIVVLVVQGFLFRVIKVDGSSMYDTLEDGERLFVTVFDVRFGEAQRGDVVICHYYDRYTAPLERLVPALDFIRYPTYFVKRVVAVPGDTVYRKNGVTHVVYTQDGEAVDEPLDGLLASRYPMGSKSDYDPYVLGDDEYFVVGDNRYNSHDSRDWKDSDPVKDVGPIKRSMIVGHVRSVIWPLNRIRVVE